MNYLNKTERKALKVFKEKLIREYPDQLQLLILFDSKARGDYDENSDIDVLVVVKKRGTSLAKGILGIAIDVMLDYGPYLSVKTMDAYHFNFLIKQESGFIKNVLSEGEFLWQVKKKE